MTEVDRRITDPHDNTPFLSWYEGVFESVYIALHPFVRIEEIDPVSAPRSVLVVDRAKFSEQSLTIDAVQKMGQSQAQCSIDLPSLREREKRFGTAVSWEEIRLACGFSSNAQVDKALLTILMAIREEYGNLSDAQHLQTYCNANQIFLPTEDTIPPVLETRVCEFLKGCGCESVTIADEFNETILSRKLIDLDGETAWALSDSVGFRFNKL